MFKRKFRLVPNVRFSSSYTFSAPEFILKEKKNGLLLNRFGIVVSKKIDKRAVVRNRIKRIFREALSELNKNMTIGHDILFIARTGVLNKTKEENSAGLKNALEKAGLFENEK